MKKSHKRTLCRGLRVTAAVAVSCLVAYTTAQPAYIGLAPVLNMLGKYLREEFKIPYLPV